MPQELLPRIRNDYPGYEGVAQNPVHVSEDVDALLAILRWANSV